jgi:O-antigen biosynthesis protein WbqP
MSFIGPRPALPTQSEINGLREEYGVHLVRPGITGLAQVMGRDDLEPEVKVCYDAEYCRQMSFLSDLKILVLTLRTVISAEGNR